MNAFFYPLKRGFYFAEIQGGKVTAYNIPVCILQPTEPVPPTVCVLEAESGGPPSDEVPLMYGGATFEIKRCSSFSPSGIYNRCSYCSSAVNPS